MAELQAAADKEQSVLQMSQHRITQQEQLAADEAFANQEYAIKLKALQQQVDALDKSGKDYENKLKALQDKETELTQQHENQIAAIQDKAQEQQNQQMQTAMTKMESEFASGFASVIMRHQSFAAMMNNIGGQVIDGMLKNAIMSALTMDMGKEKEAAAAARQMFIAGTKFPFPANIVMAPALGAMAFASMMAFNQGGLVPGQGNGDTVPAMLTPGESVNDKELTNGLRGIVKNSGSSTHHVNLHYRPTFHVQAIDRSGVQDMLHDHSSEFTKHFHNEMRKLNR
jgi:hypothetical protein